MHRTHSEKIVAFVEGRMEQLFLNNCFPYVHVISTPNGENWKVERIIEFIISTYRAKNINASKIIVWFDRENRTIDAQKIEEMVVETFVNAGLEKEKVIVCVADKMTENLILADQDLIRSEFNNDEYEYCGDGSHGKSIMKSLYKDKKINYKETYHGSLLLKKTYLSRAAVNSNFTRRFFERFDIDCWWKR